MTQQPDFAPAPIIVIVDDDPAVRNSLKFLLEIEGFSVRIYHDGTELLAERKLPKTGCLVVDYQLPGMNGLELLTELRRRHVALPAILITTNPSASVRASAKAAGVPLVEKPLLTEALFEGITAALADAAEHLTSH